MDEDRFAAINVRVVKASAGKSVSGSDRRTRAGYVAKLYAVFMASFSGKSTRTWLFLAPPPLLLPSTPSQPPPSRHDLFTIIHMYQYINT